MEGGAALNDVDTGEYSTADAAVLAAGPSYPVAAATSFRARHG
jgi:hypothetical protein